MTTVVSRFSRTVVLRRLSSSSVDEYGTPTYSDADELVSCHLRMLRSDELPAGTNSVRWKLYLDPGTAIDAGDRVVVEGDVHEVVSVPRDNYNPRTRTVESVTVEIEKVG